MVIIKPLAADKVATALPLVRDVIVATPAASNVTWVPEPATIFLTAAPLERWWYPTAPDAILPLVTEPFARLFSNTPPLAMPIFLDVEPSKSEPESKAKPLVAVNGETAAVPLVPTVIVKVFTSE